MTPQAIAHDVAAYYRENPKRNWRQGSFGTRATGCCVFGAVRYSFADEDICAFCAAFSEAIGKQTGYSGSVTIVYFNDHIAKSVDDVLVVLDKVARS